LKVIDTVQAANERTMYWRYVGTRNCEEEICSWCSQWWIDERQRSHHTRTSVDQRGHHV